MKNIILVILDVMLFTIITRCEEEYLPSNQVVECPGLRVKNFTFKNDQFVDQTLEIRFNRHRVRADRHWLASLIGPNKYSLTVYPAEMNIFNKKDGGSTLTYSIPVLIKAKVSTIGNQYTNCNDIRLYFSGYRDLLSPLYESIINRNYKQCMAKAFCSKLGEHKDEDDSYDIEHWSFLYESYHEFISLN